MSDDRVECLWFGDCPNCGPEGELVAVMIEPTSAAMLKCLECATMYRDPDSLSPFDTRATGTLRAAIRVDVAHAGWNVQARGTITATRREIEYCWEETK